MSRAEQPPTHLVAQMRELFRRLEILERSGGTSVGISGGNVPVGTVVAYWGTAAPAGWLLCNGATFDGSTYPDLEAHLGGTTLPNLKGRVVVGIDGAQTEFDTLGETGGAKTVTLTEAQLPSHDHDDAGHTHFHAHTFSTDPTEPPNHNHLLDSAVSFGTSNTSHTHYIGGGVGEVSSAPQGAGRAATSAGQTAGVDDSLSHTHSGTSLSDSTVGEADIDTAGGDEPHPNLQPYMALSYIIKAS